MGEIRNKILFIDEEASRCVLEQYQKDGKAFVAQVDGDRIKSIADYIREIQDKFAFPPSCRDDPNNIDAYLDWMRDLDWIIETGKDKLVLIIRNVRSIPSEVEDEIIYDFEKAILPFWEKEVEEVVVEGRARPFVVYLVW